MTQDIEVLQFWLRIVCVIACVTTTAVPVIYAFAPWRTRLFGRLFMLQAVSFAAAIDLITLFAFWRPDNILIVFWVEVIVISGIAVSTLLLTVMMWVTAYKNAPKRGGRHAVQRQGVQRP